jgi:hypothetical protein
LLMRNNLGTQKAKTSMKMEEANSRQEWCAPLPEKTLRQSDAVL